MISSGFYVWSRSEFDDDEEELSESVMLLRLSNASSLPESSRLVSLRILNLLEDAEKRF